MSTHNILKQIQDATASTPLALGDAGMDLTGIFPGTLRFVDGTSGLDTNTGANWDNAFLTIAAAVAASSAGDTIYIKGTAFNESVTCSLAGVKFIGIGTGPYQATWTAPTVSGGSTGCLIITGAGVLVENIKFRPVAYLASGVPSGIKLAAGCDYAIIRNCRFQGKTSSYKAIYASAGSSNVHIEGCEFIYMNTATTGAGIESAAAAACSGWIIQDCIFNSCVTGIEIEARGCLIKDNTFFVNGLAADNTFGSAVMTMGIDLTGTDTGANKICGNHLGGAYSNSLYLKGGTGDEWEGNWTRSTTATITNGAGYTLTATA